MSDVHTWSQSAAANSSPPPDGAPENMIRPAVNDVIREVMASVRRWYHGEDWSRPHGSAATSRDSSQVVRVAGADYTGSFVAGRRCRVSGGGTREGYVVSSSYSAPDTLVTVRLEPTSFAELAPGVNLTFADAGANDTITAAAGTPFSGVAAGDRVRVEKTQASHVNSGTKLVQSVGGGGSSLTLDAADPLTNEGPSAQKIYLEAVAVPVGTTLIELGRWATKSSAHRSLGVAAGEIPTADRLGTAAYAFTGAGKGLDADTVDGQHYSDILAQIQAQAPAANRLVNGEFRRWQRGISRGVISDDYIADCWKCRASDVSSTSYAKDSTTAPTGLRCSAKLTATATAGKGAVYQFLEAEECVGLIGSVASLSVYLKADASIANARLIILSWTGTEDSITTALVSAWNAAGNNPTFAANFTIEGSVQVALTGAWQRFTLENIAIDAVGAKNVGVWIQMDDDAITNGHALWVAGAKLEAGSVATTLRPEGRAELEARTHRFYAKTFAEDTTPAHGVTQVGALYANSDVAASDGVHVNWCLPARLGPGTRTFAGYNPVDAAPASGKAWRNITDSVNYSASIANGEGHLVLPIRAAESVTTNKTLAIHATVRAEFF